MRKYLILLFMMGALISIHQNAVADVPAPVSGQIEIFAQGKRYQSLHAYKLEVWREKLKKDFLASSQEDIHQFMKSYPQPIPDELTKTEIQDTLNEMARLKNKGSPTSSAEGASLNHSPQDELGQMQSMLKEYKQNHSDASALELDEQKLKTIVIKPKTNGTIP